MKALIAMSGGVDSTVAAFLMKDKGYQCMGATMKLHNDAAFCCGGEIDIEDARKVAEQINIPFEVYDYTEEFKDKVVKKFVETYQKGETPNPCIECNRYMKFDKLLLKAKENGYSKIATGHYAIIEKGENGRYLLKKAADHNKDQSYVLYSLTQEQLACIEFPLGEYTKDEVREIAKRRHFDNFLKRDSQDICFVPDGDYVSFIERYTGKSFAPGNFIDENGNVLGVHKGIINYTIGQRKGLGISSDSPLFVTNINVENNTVTLTHGGGLFTNTLYATDINLISVDKITEPMKVKAKVRYRQQEQKAIVEQIDDNTIKVTFKEPQRAITKGQAVVLYDGDIVVGGGRII